MRQRILVVDDEESARMSVELALTMAGYKVLGTSDVEDAIVKAIEARDNNNPFDLLITDFKMPKLTGLELIDQLSNHDIEIPTLIITGFADDQLVDELSQRNSVEYYEKPMDPDTLVSQVQQIIKQKRTGEIE
ncbi:MAG: response regulator [SAR324 cluster bacterium]|nr:response regulator [SAR324 cluster bacterium]